MSIRNARQTASLLFFSLYLIGCSSMQFSNYDDVIKVTTEKPGAEIYYKGKVVGVTPALIKVRRSRVPEIGLAYPGQEKLYYDVPTRYRWTESFLPNLLLFSLALVTIPIDLLTGTAWDLEDMSNIDLPGSPPRLLLDQAKYIALAPPTAKTQYLSDQGGRLLFEKLKGHPWWMVQDYSDGAGVFEDHMYVYDSPLEGDDRNHLFAELGATHVVESKISQNDPATIDYTLKSVTSNDVLERGSFAMPSKSEQKGNPWHWFFASLIPNTVSIDSSKPSIELALYGEESKFRSKSRPLAGWLGEMSKVLGTIGLTTLNPPQARNRVKFGFRPISTFSLSVNRYVFDTTKFDFRDTEFETTKILGGLGGEFYFQSVVGTIYFDAYGFTGYSEIAWNSPVSNGSLGRGLSGVGTGLGWYWYFTNRLAIRLFAKYVTEDKRNWSWAIDQSQGADLQFNDVSYFESGGSVMWYFPEIGRTLRK